MPQETEQLYRKLFETSQEIIFITDKQTGQIVDATPAACNLYGYSKNEFLGMKCTDISTEPEEIQQVMHNHLTDIPLRYHIKKDGTKFPVEITVSCFKLGERSILTSFIKDLTQRRKAEQTLIEANVEDITDKELITKQLEMFKVSIDKHFDGAYWMDTDNRFVFVNEAGCKALQYTREELLTMRVSDVNPSSSSTGMEFVWNKLRKEGAFVSETIHRRKDGTEFPVEISSTYVKFGDKEYNCGFARDITERRIAENELKESEASLSSLIQHRQESIWSIDKNFRYVIANDMFKKAYFDAYHINIEPGIAVMEGLSPEHWAFWKPKYEAALSGETVQFEFCAFVFNQTRYFSVSITPVKVNENVIGASVISIDSTYRKKGEEALQQSEEKFRRIAEQMVDVLFTTDIKGVITYLSPSCQSVFGWQANEIVGKLLGELLNDNSKGIAKEALRVMLETASPTNNLTLQMLTKNGDVFPGELHSNIIRDNKGQITGTLGLIRNISDKVLYEETLTNERNQLRTLIDNLPDFIFIKDADGRYIINNKSHLRSIGKEQQDDVLGILAFDLHQTEFAEKYRKDEFEIIQSGQALIDKEESVFRMDMNEVRWHLTSKIPIKDSKGRVTSIVGISRDITERKQIEDALKTSEEKYRTLFENMTVGFALHEMIFDENGNPVDYKFLEVNPVFEKLTGLKASEIIDKRVREVIPNIEQYWIDFYGKVVKTGVSASYQNFVLEFGKHYNVWVFSPKDNHFATIFNDITAQMNVQESLKLQNEEYQSLNEEYMSLNEELLERNNRLDKFNKELEIAKGKAEESDRLKTAFLCNMSHEIRTPMNAILGFSEFIVRPELAEEKKVHYSKLIKDRTYDLLKIIEDILDISKIEIGQMRLAESKIHVTSLLNDLLEYYIERKEAQKTAADIEISLNISRNFTNPIIVADGQRLKQVLMNFLDNSLKFTKKGSIELGCEVMNSDKLLFTVSDTGIGIPADKQDIIFDRFRQAEDLYSSRHYGGTGLGLSIAKGLAHLMGGEIWLESEVNVGTKFFFSIPYKGVNLAYQKKEKLQIPMELHWFGKTILVVEDDEASAELLTEFVEVTQVRVINAYTGKDALEAFLATENLDLVLLDIRLPDANGLDIAHKMKSLRPNIPIIAQTAYATESDYKDSIDAGCDSYIAKPIQRDKLLELISKFV